MIAEVLGRLAAVVVPLVGRPEELITQAVVVALLVGVALVVVAVCRVVVPVSAAEPGARAAFAAVRVPPSASDPDARGHARPRAPGATR